MQESEKCLCNIVSIFSPFFSPSLSQSVLVNLLAGVRLDNTIGMNNRLPFVQK